MTAEHLRSSEIAKGRDLMHQASFDETFGYYEEELSDWQKIKRFIDSRRRGVISAAAFLQFLTARFPILQWLPCYDFRANLLSDVAAGITVGIMHIPQSMAYASLAGLPPVYGMYTSFFPSLLYMFFGTSAHISLGTIAVSSLLTASVRYRFVPDDVDILSPNYNATTTDDSVSQMEYVDALTNDSQSLLDSVALATEGNARIHPIVVVTALTFLVGVFQVLLGAIGAGFLMSYLSEEVVGGYTSGTAIIILASQLEKLFGVHIRRYEGPLSAIYKIIDVIHDLPYEINWVTTGISLCSMITILLVKMFINDRYKKRLKVPIPIDLIVFAGCLFFPHAVCFPTAAVVVFSQRKYRMPVPTAPAFRYLPRLVADALPCAIIIYALSLSMAKIFAQRHKYKVDPNQEFYAFGFLNIIGSFFCCYPCAASLSRSSVLESAGSKTQLAGGLSSLVVLVVLLWIAPLFEALPMCVLASIIVVALKSLILQVGMIGQLWKISKIDSIVFLVSFVATVILDATYGLALSVVFAILTVVLRSQSPRSSVLGRLGNTDSYRPVGEYREAHNVSNVRIFRFNADLQFANAELFREKLLKTVGLDQLTDQSQQRQRACAKNKTKTTCFKTSICSEEEKPTQKLVCRLRNMLSITRVNTTATVTNSSSATLTRTESAVDQSWPVKTCENLGFELVETSFGCDKPVTQVLPPRQVIIDCSCFNFVDVTGKNQLLQVYRELSEAGIGVWFAECNSAVLRMFRQSNIFTCVPYDRFAPTVHHALGLARKAQSRDISKFL